MPRSVGIEVQVHEEVRLADPDVLRELRGSLGRMYQKSLVPTLTVAPHGLTFLEVVSAVRDRQLHTADHGSIRAVLSAGGFVQIAGLSLRMPRIARHLRLAIGTTYPSSGGEPDDPGAIIRAIDTRLHQIVELLRQSRSTG
ncbi:MAG TPA: hypothetical protein VFB58_05460 [Chloroflexota bacterium]|nr:hypothetical protein [Chloroflexota bacterium]